MGISSAKHSPTTDPELIDTETSTVNVLSFEMSEVIGYLTVYDHTAQLTKNYAKKDLENGMTLEAIQCAWEAGQLWF